MFASPAILTVIVTAATCSLVVLLAAGAAASAGPRPFTSARWWHGRGAPGEPVRHRVRAAVPGCPTTTSPPGATTSPGACDRAHRSSPRCGRRRPARRWHRSWPRSSWPSTAATRSPGRRVASARTAQASAWRSVWCAPAPSSAVPPPNRSTGPPRPCALAPPTWLNATCTVLKPGFRRWCSPFSLSLRSHCSSPRARPPGLRCSARPACSAWFRVRR